MFPTQVFEWQSEQRLGSPPIGSGSSFDVTDNPIEVHLRELAKLRDAYPALSIGSTTVRSANGKVLVVSRFDPRDAREYVAAFNSGSTAVEVTVPVSTSLAGFTRVFGSGAVSSGDYKLTLKVAPVSSVLARAEAPLTLVPPVPPALSVTGDDLSNMWRVTAAVAGVLPVSVTFAVKRGGGPWTRLSVDDSPPYRAFLDPAKFRKNEHVNLVAIVRSLDGKTAVSTVVPFTIRGR
jgi:hypothetical protein